MVPDTFFLAIPESFRDLLRQVAILPPESLDAEPWFVDGDLKLPSEQQFPLADQWLERCQSSGIRLSAMRSDVVLTRRFNEQTQGARDSKGQALTEISMNLLRHVWLECGVRRTRPGAHSGRQARGP